MKLEGRNEAHEAPEKEPQEVGETKAEPLEAPEVIKRVEQATFEPEAMVQHKGDYKQAETIAAKIKIRTSGLLNWRDSSPTADVCRCALSVFGPYCLMRLSASACWMPLLVVCSAAMSCSAVRVQ
jgi:hypothetical protein